MSESGRVTAVKVYEDRRHAHLAVEELVRQGFTLEQIGFVMPDERNVVDVPRPHHETKTEEGVTAGAVSGGTIGGLVGAALASSILPGVGPVIAGGILVGIVTGAVTGLAGGGLLGALIGMSVPEEEAIGYEKEFHDGRTVVTVRADGRYDEAVAILDRAQDAPEHIELHPGARAARISESSGPSPGSGNVYTP